MKTLFIVLQAPAEDALTRMALSALEAEARMRDIALSVVSTFSGDAPVLYVNAENRPKVIRETADFLDAIAPRKHEAKLVTGQIIKPVFAFPGGGYWQAALGTAGSAA